jgi:polar amino acid transport system substrate-binding protein
MSASEESERSAADLVSRRSLGTLSLTGAALLATVPLPAKAQIDSPKAAGRLDRILSSGKLRVGQYLQYKPYGFKTPSGEPDGYDVDLTKMLAEDMGVKPEFIDSTWEGIIPGLLSDKFDLITANLAVTVKRSLVVQYANPISFTSSGFILRSDQAGNYPTLEALNSPDVTVSVLIQDAVHGTLARFFPKARIVDFNSADEAILAMQTGKVKVSAAEISYLTQFSKEHSGLTVKAIDYPGSSNPAAMAMVPGADNMHLLSFVNNWVQFYYWTGRFEPLWQKWIPWNPVPKVEKFMAPV